MATLDDLYKAIFDLLPETGILIYNDEQNDGELVIHVGRKEAEDGTLVSLDNTRLKNMACEMTGELIPHVWDGTAPCGRKPSRLHGVIAVCDKCWAAIQKQERKSA